MRPGQWLTGQVGLAFKRRRRVYTIKIIVLAVAVAILPLWRDIHVLIT